MNQWNTDSPQNQKVKLLVLKFKIILVEWYTKEMKTIIVWLPVEGAIRYSREIVGFLSLGNVFVESRTPCIFASKDFCSQGHVTTTIHSDFCCIYYEL